MVDDAVWAVGGGAWLIDDTDRVDGRGGLTVGPVVAAALSVDVVPSVSRRAGCQHHPGHRRVCRSAGVARRWLNSGASRLDGRHDGGDGSRGAAVPVVTASLSANRIGHRTAAAPDCAAVPEVSVPDAFIAAAGGACIERASLSAAV